MADHSHKPPKQELAMRILKKLFPERVPNKVELADGTLCQMAQSELKKQKHERSYLPDLSDDTFLRAAGRRKDLKQRK